MNKWSEQFVNTLKINATLPAATDWLMETSSTGVAPATYVYGDDGKSMAVLYTAKGYDTRPVVVPAYCAW